MNQKDLAETLNHCLTNRLPLIVEGAPGIGKTAIAVNEAKSLGMDVLVTYPVTENPTDYGGVLWPDVEKGIATALPKDLLHKALNATKPTMFMIDDFGQGVQMTQNAAGHLIHARTVGGRKLPDCVTFVINANRRTDRAGSQAIVSTIISRASTTVTLTPTVEHFLPHAFEIGMHPAITKYLKTAPQNLYTETPDTGKPYPCPRSWEAASKLLSFPEHLQQELLVGAVGSCAVDMLAVSRLMHHELNAEEALRDPKYKLPSKPDHMIAIVSACAYYGVDKVKQALALVTRLQNSGMGEFGGFLLAELLARKPNIAYSAEFIKFANSGAGSRIQGLG
jgi:hypothetical protein